MSIYSRKGKWQNIQMKHTHKQTPKHTSIYQHQQHHENHQQPPQPPPSPTDSRGNCFSRKWWWSNRIWCWQFSNLDISTKSFSNIRIIHQHAFIYTPHTQTYIHYTYTTHTYTYSRIHTIVILMIMIKKRIHQ